MTDKFPIFSVNDFFMGESPYGETVKNVYNWQLNMRLKFIVRHVTKSQLIKSISLSER